VRKIIEKATGSVLAKGADGDVLELEGNLYFDPESVDRTRLVVTDATYTCPYKGTCNWVDIRDGAQRVAWVYPDPKPGFEQIKDRYGFYRGERGATFEG
jgi:uncharacterized protein (DUF427 family)